MSSDGACTPDGPVRVFVYGSCVGRDSIGSSETSETSLLDYVARQSIISSMGPPVDSPVAISASLKSTFQRSMVDGDLSSSLSARVSRSHAKIDVLLWDLTDERFGVRHAEGGGYFTPTSEAVVGFASDPVFRNSRLIPFGSDEHFALFQDAASRFAEFLNGLELFSSVLVLGVPHSDRVDVNGVIAVDSVLTGSARLGNAQFGRYLNFLSERLGFALLALPHARVSVDSEHKWGLAPFHYSRKVYGDVLEGVLATGRARQERDRMNMSAPPRLVDRSFAGERRLFTWGTLSDLLDSDELAPGIHTVRIEHGMELDFTISGPLGGNANVPVFFTGAISEAYSRAPVFVGAGIAGELGVPYVSFADPTLYHAPRPLLGWYLGSEFGDLVGSLTSILDHIAEVSGCRFIMCGGSGGGFAALHFASRMNHLRASAFVWNAQTDVLRYGWSSVDSYLASSFPSEYVLHAAHANLDEWRLGLGERSVQSSLLEPGTIAGLRNVLFVQEEADWHVQAHFEPLLRAAVAKRVSPDRWRAPGDVVFVLKSWSGSHTPPSRQILTGALRLFLEGRSATETADGLEGLEW